MARHFGGVTGKGGSVSVYEADDKLSPKYTIGKPIFLPRRAFIVVKQARTKLDPFPAIGPKRTQVCVELNKREILKLTRALERWRKNT